MICIQGWKIILRLTITMLHYVGIHVHILRMHFSMIFQSQIRENYNIKCELAAVLLPSLLPSLLAQFISAYAEINSATGNWQLIGNYAILTKNNQRVFLYENGELNGVQFLFFNIWPGLKPEYHFKIKSILSAISESTKYILTSINMASKHYCTRWHPSLEWS